jgi:hypothetical protein
VADSPRARLARMARDAAEGDAAVSALDGGAGGRYATTVDGETVPGVVCVAMPGGGYSVDVHVVAHLEDLHALGERLRRVVLDAATRVGLGDELAGVSVHVEDVVAS